MKQKYWVEENPTCRNCETPLPEEANYCPTCAQRNTTGKVKVWDFAKDAFSNLFNLDTKLIRTAWSLFIPGRLTNEFFKGKHKSYASPVRMFLVSAIFFFAMVGFRIDSFNITPEMFWSKDVVNYKESLKILERAKEETAKNMTNPKDLAMLDSMFIKMAKLDQSKSSNGNFSFNITGYQYKIPHEDLRNLPVDTLIKKYKINDMLDQHIFRQAYKLTKEPKSMLASLIGNMTWMLLLQMPFMALIFKLLYIRRKRFYVEHLVFLFHYHAFVLLLGTGILIFMNQMPAWLAIALSVSSLLYLLLAMIFVYQQNIWKSIVKFFIAFFSYLLFLILFFALTTFVSILLF